MKESTSINRQQKFLTPYLNDALDAFPLTSASVLTLTFRMLVNIFLQYWSFATNHC